MIGILSQRLSSQQQPGSIEPSEMSVVFQAGCYLSMANNKRIPLISARQNMLYIVPHRRKVTSGQW